MNSYNAKKQAKLERYQQYADNADRRAETAQKTASQIASYIPFGQPILVGHHSEKRHRRDLKRIDSNMHKALEESKKSEYYQRKIDSIESNKNIDSDDPEAVQKLQEKIAKLEADQEKNKAVNKYIRKNDREGLKSMGLSDETIDKLFTPDFCGRIGIPGYVLTNNNANIRRLKDRLTSLQNQVKLENFEINNIKVEFNDGQIQVYFPFKPCEESRTMLKRSPIALKWSSYSKAWVRKLTPSINDFYLSELKKVLTEVKS